MEDYIFIIIAIVLSAIGAINKNKKKRIVQQDPEQREPTRQPSFFDQLFEDPAFKEEPEPIPVRQPQERIEKPTFQRTVRREVQTPIRRTTLKKTEIGDSIKKKIKTSFDEDQEETENTRESIRDDFSLRKAIIYSEILARKY